MSVQGGQKGVMVIRDAKDIKTVPGSIAWHQDGNTMMVGARDGSLQLWELRGYCLGCCAVAAQQGSLASRLSCSPVPQLQARHRRHPSLPRSLLVAL